MLKLNNVIIFAVFISTSAFSNFYPDKVPLMVNSTWGYYPVTIDNNECTVYEARTTRGLTIIKAPVYRIGKFIFSTTTFENCW